MHIEPKILTIDEIVAKGTEFTDDVCYSGTSGQELYDRPLEEGGKLISGLVYEKNRNGKVVYYAHYINGIEEKEYVEFFENGLPSLYRQIIKGTTHGIYISWHKNRQIKMMAAYKYGFKKSYKEWNEYGNVISEQLEAGAFEKEMIEKYDNWSAHN
ncbi:hypothetical protein [Paenibacillus kandeliae]|uniref:hypothetical protein n=1 Tax=Paenibacillus kandeliae TaxID=3231269 RepID=UPI003459B2F7